MTAAYQPNAYQKNAYQTDAIVALPAFQANAFQFGAFQQDESPIPPEPLMDGHDGGRRKRALKKLQELEDKRIALIKEQAERRKLQIQMAFDPQAKVEYEAKAPKAKVSTEKQIAKVDKQIEKLVELTQKLELKSIITSELARIHTERQVYAAQIRKQIQEADDELALMMMM